ncbi:MAG: 16S rRNA (cytosine(1402)-N(4))-methyltransferase RsmH [Syntrophomonadaceae bacterium]|nr:16S rRNA (cytosine(1402)-N(4))-methyltransferase RsmH [Syntrophomonadaceae bacterium]
MHQPVLLGPSVENWLTDPHGCYIDCTVGGGGHTKALLEKLSQDAQVLAIDRDKDTLDNTRRQLTDNRVRFIEGDFRDLSVLLDEEGIKQADGIMIDLGVSSFQLDQAERGFSFHEDARLDMRMDRSEPISAWDVVNQYDPADIADILFRYGEEKYARSIAAAIVRQRIIKPIDTTLQLVEIIQGAVPAKYRREKHPARKTFQALRIEVNRELEAIEEVMPQAVEVLRPSGHLCIISFHSLEDRIVKTFMQKESKECVCPPGLPVCICKHQPRLRIIARKPIIADEEECEANPRARSAKLRVAARI